MAGGNYRAIQSPEKTYGHKTRKSKNGIAPTSISFTNLKLLTFMKLRISSAKIRRKIIRCKYFLNIFKKILRKFNKLCIYNDLQKRGKAAFPPHIALNGIFCIETGF